MNEREIRPEHLLTLYLALSARDAETLFSGDDRESIPCVACGAPEHSRQFTKSGFDYALCQECGTLFQNPRPSISAFEQFYRESESSRYWAEEFFPAVAEIRRERIFRPRVERLSAICAERRLTVNTIVDVGAGFGIFLEEWQRKHPETAAIGIEPSQHLAQECRRKGLDILECMLEDVVDRKGTADLVVCFEVLEHAHSPVSFLQALASLARPGGHVLVSTLCIDGFDLQILWDQSPQISPPHHINFMSVRGFSLLFERAGFSEVAVTTPGVLDVDIIRNAAIANPSLLGDQRVLRKLVQEPGLSDRFQQFLAENRLSSHAWVLGKLPELELE